MYSKIGAELCNSAGILSYNSFPRFPIRQDAPQTNHTFNSNIYTHNMRCKIYSKPPYLPGYPMLRRVQKCRDINKRKRGVYKQKINVGNDLDYLS